MRAALGFLLLAAAAVAVSWQVALLPGTVSLSLGDRTYAAAVPVAILAAAVTFVLLYALVRLFGLLVRLPRTARRWRADRARGRGEEAVTRALVALAAGDGAAAQREAERARDSLGEGPVTLLLSASAERLAGREDAAQAAFEALAARPDAAFLGLRGLLRQAVAKGDLDAAADLARRAEAVQPGAAWLRRERQQIALRTGAWQEALRLAAPERPEGRAALAAAAAEAASDLDEATRLAKAAWEADPRLAPAALAYARRLRQSGKERAAQDVLRRAWAATPHPDLAAFALEPAAEPLARAKAAQALVTKSPDSVDSHLLLARVSLAAGLPGEARRHLDEAAASGRRERRLSVLRADLAEAEGNAAGARDALREAATAAPDPAWHCASCGTVQPAWHPLCAACGDTGSLAWTTAGSPGRRLAQERGDGQDVAALP